MITKAILAFALVWLLMPPEPGLGIGSSQTMSASSYLRHAHMVAFDALDRVRADLKANRPFGSPTFTIEARGDGGGN